jgi:hypothetical protein
MSNDEAEAKRARALYEEGARRLADAWDEADGLIRHQTEFGVFHDARGSLAYADVLLREGGDDAAATARRIIDTVASMQETREQDAHYGNFRWFFEDECVTDLNAVEFVLDGLNAIVADHASKLDQATLTLIHAMIALGLREIDRLDVHVSYTNIALSDICNSVLGGQAIGDERYVERGARRLQEWLAFTDAAGAPHEYNSPTYLAVDLMRLAALAEHARDASIAKLARLAEDKLWLHVAAHYHPGLAQLAGPHSRAYRDGWTGAGGYLKLILWRILGDETLRAPTPYFPRGREEGHIGVALTTFHPPALALELLRDKRYPYETIETVDAARRTTITTYMTPSYALGSASASYGVGEPPEPWPQPSNLLLHFQRAGDPHYGVLFTRYVVNDKGPGAVMHESNRSAEDFWEEGQHVATQSRNRAIVAYGLRPRTRPAHSYKLSLRALGVDDAGAIWCDDRRLDAAAFPLRVEPLSRIVIDTGDVYIALIPLRQTDMGSDAPIQLDVRDGMLRLDIYNYRGPAKTFWEHRSQAGPFFQGNVRNAAVIEVAERTDYPSPESFREHVTAATIDDTTSPSKERTITHTCACGSTTLRYDLRHMHIPSQPAGSMSS